MSILEKLVKRPETKKYPVTMQLSERVYKPMRDELKKRGLSFREFFEAASEMFLEETKSQNKPQPYPRQGFYDDSGRSIQGN